jgi:hypothetical protein
MGSFPAQERSLYFHHFPSKKLLIERKTYPRRCSNLRC